MTSGAEMGRLLALLEVDGAGTAVGAELGADEHHAEAFGAGDGLQQGVAVFTLGGVLRGGCAHWGQRRVPASMGGLYRRKDSNARFGGAHRRQHTTHNAQRLNGGEGEN